MPSSVLMYAHDSAAGTKHDRARKLVERLWDEGTGVVSTQVLEELCVNLRRKLARPLPVDDVRQLVQDYLSWEVVGYTPESIL
jgi:predicted nucleic acid-binding protein